MKNNPRPISRAPATNSAPPAVGTQSSALDRIERDISVIDGKIAGHFAGLRIESHFQPIYSLAHRRPVGYEALMRGYGDQAKPVSPLDIFRSVESVEQSIHLDRLCRTIHIRNFIEMENRRAWLFLNINSQVVIGGALRGPYFRSVLERYGLPPHRVVVEIIEERIQDESLLANAVNYYKDLGCLVAIDDFGAGHSNFDRIWRIAPHIVKLDRSMIVQGAQQARVRRVLPNLVSLIHESGSLALMEGIETEREALIAADSGIDLVQGFYFGRPSPLSTRNPDENILLSLCGKFKEMTRQEYTQRKQEMSSYIEGFLYVARLIESDVPLERACSALFRLDRTARCYLLDSEGRQLGKNIDSPLRQSNDDPRFLPLSDAGGAVWSRRPYFRQAMNNPRQIQITRPYLSITGVNMCITVSMAVRKNDEMLVLCCDLDWHED